ncbi:pyridine nucleotide-disulfide oxidoreductase [Chroococcidiopsis cubana SAG 39.79]|uniref:Pyridine nucleotide-disulfide oxidoreductase n=1 Tax=Chroococcidiopsis cubana SAG 39.79 TaxID=388085 RepID=A0AB37UHK4_9CYAN|nr:apoptosis inducing factor family protein [Chroococcidiopsis cubana]RUT10799.1 pyridine nucleotide-disulfide oxidoreductase [Chroococcidiopsis cubana SAG 39.79]
MPQLEAVVANINDLQNGEMRQVSVGETDVLLVRLADKYYALGAYCTHYQAPLAEGVLCDNHVVCPWHNAYFDLTTGEQQEPPGLDSLQKYEVKIEGDRIIVSIPENAAGRRQPNLAEYNPEDKRTFVILGAGAAGAHAAETLRVAGYQGRIVMVTQDDRLPYDRTWLSKDYLTGKVTQDDMPLRSAQFYQDCHIEVWLNKQVVQVDVSSKSISFADGESLQYDALLLATGGKPRQLNVPGSDLQNIFTVRSFADTDRILAAAGNAKRAVVIGSSFIGMEAASGLTQRGLEVTVVSPSTLPFEKILGAEIGKLFQQVHEENGVKFHLGRKATQIEGDGKVEAVVLDNGDRLDADLVVVGIGVQPATEFLQGLELHPKAGSVQVNEYLQAADGVYAAGDIARYPNWRTGEPTRIEHWRVAAQHGRIAAYNMAGQQVKYRGVPIFWTMQFQFPLRYVGHAEQWDEIIFQGDLQQREFMAFYVQGDRVLAAAASQRDTEAAAIVELMRLDRMPAPDELRRPDLDLVELLRS